MKWYQEESTNVSIVSVSLLASSPHFGHVVYKNSLLRVLREDEIIYEGNLTSLKRFKDDVNEVKNGFECGIGVAGFYDFQENDVIEVYAKKEVKRTLK